MLSGLWTRTRIPERYTSNSPQTGRLPKTRVNAGRSAFPSHGGRTNTTALMTELGRKVLTAVHSTETTAEADPPTAPSEVRPPSAGVAPERFVADAAYPPALSSPVWRRSAS